MPSTHRSEASLANVTASTLAAARLGAAQALAAWPVLIGRVMFYLLILVVLAALWDKVAAEQVTPLAGMLPDGGLAVYIGTTEWVTLSVIAIERRLEDDIRNGGLEPYLLRPQSYLLQRVAPAVANRGARCRRSASFWPLSCSAAWAASSPRCFTSWSVSPPFGRAGSCRLC
jgi:ABC-type uncharacterized transport system permease subunit